MAGGTSGKTGALLLVALAKLDEAKKAIQQLSQHGNPASTATAIHTISDPAITAAITALQAIQ